MSTESEVILSRYKARQKEPDALGRVITVRKLKPSEQAKVTAMTSDLDGYDELIDPNSGDPVKIPQRMPLVVASAVCMIDDAHIPFPKSRGELDAIYDRLDVEGIQAAGIALARLSPVEAAPENPVDDAKN